MLTNFDAHEAETDMALQLLASGDEAGFRKHMAALGFDEGEIDRHIELERAVERKP
jgi:hypothetical protein